MITVVQAIISAIFNLAALVTSLTGLVIALQAHQRVGSAGTRIDVLQDEVRNGNGNGDNHDLRHHD